MGEAVESFTEVVDAGIAESVADEEKLVADFDTSDGEAV